jgi:hypothetical protein
VGTDASDIVDDDTLRQKFGSEFLGPAGLAKLDIRVTESVTVDGDFDDSDYRKPEKNLEICVTGLAVVPA